MVEYFLPAPVLGEMVHFTGCCVRHSELALLERFQLASNL